ncbi:MAG: glycosyltransferase family 2 protein [Pseudomonadota bacterium]|nr:glycosyltransferase family 2 protein [Pseudomonadota bacterium]
MELFINLVLLQLALPAILAGVYLLSCTVLSGRPRLAPRSLRQLRFDVIVPAHNEAAGIARTVESLLRLDWPQDRFRVLVIADNCTDSTASIARAAGAHVLERSSESHRGKGYALAYAFEQSRAKGWADALAIVDADAEASANMLEAFAARIERGAEAVQAHYGVLNPLASWRTRLITIAKASFHIVRSRARERLGVSCGVRGNGWCVTQALLRRVPYGAFSLAEDLEYGIELGLAGFRVEYADEADCNADMVSGAQAAGKQRQRWEAGRFQLVETKTLPLLKAAIRRRSLVCLDLALDLLVLPLSYIVLDIVALLVLAGLANWGGLLRWPWVWYGTGMGCMACVLSYVMRGWQLSGIGARGLLDLARAPGFLIWKVLLMLGHKSPVEWIRTDREKPEKHEIHDADGPRR